MSDLRTDRRSLTTLLGEAVDQFSQLIQAEAKLAGAEVAQKVKNAGTGIGMLLVGVLLILPAIVLILLALSMAVINQGISPVTAHLVVGGTAVAFGAIFMLIGLSKLKSMALLPEITISQIKTDISSAKELVR
jgi:hypothetical protein